MSKIETFTVEDKMTAHALDCSIGEILQRKVFRADDYSYICTGGLAGELTLMTDRERTATLIWNPNDNDGRCYFSVRHTLPGPIVHTSIGGYFPGQTIGRPVAPFLDLLTSGPTKIRIQFGGQWIPYWTCNDPPRDIVRTYSVRISFETFTRAEGLDEGPNLPLPRDTTSYRWFDACHFGCEEDH